MCIIVVKEKDKKLPTKEILQNCYNNNSDGCGFSFYNERSNEIITFKGFLKFEDFYKKLTNIQKAIVLSKSAMIFHFRISTSGLTDPGNTHPFPITQNDEYLRTLSFKSTISFCHNGIISAYNKKDSILSDTQLFSKKVLYPLYKMNKNFFHDNDILSFLRDFTTSKLAILTNENVVYRIGDFIEKDGLYFSNTTYQKRTYYNSYNYSYYDWDEWDYWYKKKSYPTLYKNNEKTNTKKTDTKHYSFMIYENIKLSKATFNEILNDSIKLKTNYKIKTADKKTIKIDKNNKYIADKMKNVYIIDNINNMIKKEYKAIDILKNNQSIFKETKC